MSDHFLEDALLQIGQVLRLNLFILKLALKFLQFYLQESHSCLGIGSGCCPITATAWLWLFGSRLRLPPIGRPTRSFWSTPLLATLFWLVRDTWLMRLSWLLRLSWKSTFNFDRPMECSMLLQSAFGWSESEGALGTQSIQVTQGARHHVMHKVRTVNFLGHCLLMQVSYLGFYCVASARSLSLMLWLVFLLVCLLGIVFLINERVDGVPLASLDCALIKHHWRFYFVRILVNVWI